MTDVLELTIAAQVALELPSRGIQGPPGVAGFKYFWSTSTTAADPGAGNIKANNATLASATALYISETDALGRALAAIIATWDDGTSAVRGILTLFDPVTPANFAVFNITGALTDNGAWDTIPVTHVNSSGTLSNQLALFITFDRTGDQGPVGPVSGPGSSTTDHIATFNGGTGQVIKDSGVDIASLASTASVAAAIAALLGKHSIWMPAAAMTSRTTNGPAAGTLEMTTNKVMFKTLDFDATTQEFAQFSIRMPKSWNEGTVSFFPVWSHAATVTNFGVVWGLQAVAISDDDAGDAAFGTAQTSTDTGGTTNDIYQGAESSAITIAGTPATGDWVVFQVYRDPAAGSDTLAVDARLHGLLVLYTVDASKDD